MSINYNNKPCLIFDIFDSLDAYDRQYKIYKILANNEVVFVVYSKSRNEFTIIEETRNILYEHSQTKLQGFRSIVQKEYKYFDYRLRYSNVYHREDGPARFWDKTFEYWVNGIYCAQNKEKYQQELEQFLQDHREGNLKINVRNMV